jgi:hypothetical protein
MARKTRTPNVNAPPKLPPGEVARARESIHICPRTGRLMVHIHPLTAAYALGLVGPAALGAMS